MGKCYNSPVPFSKKLECWKAEHNYSEERLAKKIGVSTSTIGNWVRGRSEPELYNLRLLCEATGLDANYWVGV